MLFYWLSVFLALVLSASAQAQGLERVLLVFGSSGGNLTAFWVAKEANLYRKNGLDVDMVFLRGSTTAINAIVSGEAQFAALGASSAILSRLGGSDTVMIATAAPGLAFYLVTKPEITTKEELRGKRLGVSRPGTDSDVATRLALEKIGLTDKDVQILSVGGDAERLLALKQGVVEGTVVSPGSLVAARKLGFRPFLDLLQMGISYEQAGLITTHSLTQKRPDTVQRFVKSFVEAIHYAKNHRDSTILVLKKYMRTEDKDVLDANYDYYVGRVFPMKPYVSQQGLEAVLDFLKRSNRAADRAKVEEFMDNSFVRRLEEEGFIRALYGR
jgi:NitT/TauT family transport system substrate-binding protein